MPDIAISVFLISVIALSAPLVLAALGGLFSERSGVINIALEGSMLSAACAAGLVSMITGSAYIGLLAALITGIAAGLLHAVLTQMYRIDHIISGMGINALALGGTSFLLEEFNKRNDVTRAPGLPTWFYWLVAALAVAFSVFVFARARFGWRLLAIGNDPEKSRQMGLEPIYYRFKALAVTGLLCGVAGALLVASAGSFESNMTAGRGYIALAALILGGWRPLFAMFACLFFGVFQAIQINLQGSPVFGIELPPEFYQSLPYLVTILVLILASSKNRAPSGLGQM